MKALKYGLTLVLGLSMSVCGGTQLFAQSSRQTREVTPQNPNPLPEEPAIDAAWQEEPQGEYRDALRPPVIIDNLMGAGKYTEVVTELDKLVKSGEGDACHRLFMAYQTYASLMNFDAAQAEEYTKKQNEVKVELEKKCANSAVTYLMKALENQSRPDAVVALTGKAMEIDSTLELCYELRGHALWQLNRAEEACDVFAKGAEQGNPVLVSLYSTYCRAFMPVESAE